MRNLPLRGQAANQLESLVPGATLGASSGNFSVNGSRPIYNDYLTEGALDTDPFRGTQELGQQAIMATPAVLLPPQAIREIQVIPGATAEYGASGAVVLTTIKSGTDHLHGSVFEFFDNEALTANNFFNNAFHRRRPEFRNNQFGETLGGGIPGTHDYFFSSYAGQREQVSVTFASRFPTTAEIQKATSALESTGGTVNPLGRTILSLYPAQLGSGALSFSDLGHNNSNTVSFKVDHPLTNASSISATYLFGRDEQLFPQGAFKLNGGSRLPQWQTQDHAGAHLAGLVLTRQPSNSVTENIGIGYSRFYVTTYPTDRAFDPASIGINTGANLQRDGGLPEIDIAPGQYEDLGGNNRMPRARGSNVYNGRAAIAITRGPDQWSIGGNFARLNESAFNDNGFRGHMLFDGSQLGRSLASDFAEASLIDLLTGLPAPSSTAIARGDTQRYLQQSRAGAFINDRRRLKERATITYGLRYDYFSVPAETAGNGSNFLPNAGLVPVGSPLLPTLYQRQRGDFAPRIGATVRLPHELTLEAGYGLYFDAAPFEQYLDNSNNPNTVLAGPMYNPIGPGATFTVTPPAPIPFGPGVPIFGSATPRPPFDLFAVDTHLHDPRMHNYNVGLSRQLSSSARIRVGYFGSVGHRLPVVVDINAPTPGASGTNAEQLRRPYNARFPNYKVIDTLTDRSYSNYNSLQASLETRATERLTLKASYTWSKWLDLNSSGSGTHSGYPEDPQNIRLDYGPSDYDTPQRFTASFAYALPSAAGRRGWWARLLNNWEMNGIATFQAGKPLNITLASDNSGTGVFADRPNLVGDPYLPFDPTGPYLNPGAFALPAPGTFGNLGRNVFRSPGLANIDYSLVKLVHLNQARSLRFRAEFFNLFNHPNFSDPSSTFGSGFRLTSTPDAGNPYFGAGGPRDVQLVAEFIF